jgi:hypothetical protein
MNESELDVNNFTSVTVYDGSISLIGNYNKELYEKCQSLGYKFEWNEEHKFFKAFNDLISIHLFIKP